MAAVDFDVSNPKQLREGLSQLSTTELSLLHWRLKWRATARKKQLPPADNEWDFFGIKSGRGWGKTLSSSNWLGLAAAHDPGSYNFVISPTHEDIIGVDFYGPTGLHAVIPKELIKDSTKSPPVITLYNDAIIRGFSADTPERLRGPQCNRAVCGEVACLVPGTLVRTDRGETLIENIRAGDLVLTRKGLRKVLGAGLSSPSAELWEMTVSNGAKLVGTGHHPVWSDTAGDFIPLRSLQRGDTLHGWQQSSFGTGSVGTGGLTTTKTAGVSSYTALSTRKLTGLFQRALTYTTATITHVITASAIWLRCLVRITSKSTVLEAALNGPLRNGLSNASANGGRKSLEQLFAVRVGSLTQLQDSVLSGVASSVRTIPTRVEKLVVCTVRKLPVSGPVYNLEVDDAHEFYANGVLTHNSWRYPEKTWDNLIFGLRLGTHPQVFWTGTPKPKPFIKMLTGLRNSITISGSTYENAENLSDIFYENIIKYEGTRIGRQEIHGEIIDPEEAGFVKRSDIRLWPAKKPLPKFRFVLMSLDTAMTEESWNKKDQTGDPTACTVWGLFEHERRDHIMLLDAWEEHLGFPELIRRVKHERTFTYGDHEEPILRPALISRAQRPRHQGRPIDLILIEDKVSGRSLIQMLAAEGVLTVPFQTQMDKLSRLHGASPLFPHGRVWAVESLKRPGEPRDWAEGVITQLCTYVGEGSLAHDDLLDTATQALLFVMQRFNIRLTVRSDPAKATREATERLKQQKRRNPYDG